MEAVQRKTVTNKHARPSVLLATFAIPDFRFAVGTLSLSNVLVVDVVSSNSSNEFDVLCLAKSLSKPGLSGIDGSTGAMMLLLKINRGKRMPA